MHIERFEAPTLAEALAQVKARLGDDAVILQTQTNRKGGLLGIGGRQVAEVVAATGVQVVKRDFQSKLASQPAQPANQKILPGPGHTGDEARLQGEIRQLQGMIRQLSRKYDQTQEPDVAPPLLDRYSALLKGEVSEDLAKALVRRLQVDLKGDQIQDSQLVADRLKLYISRLVGPGGPITPRPGQTTRIAFVGPTGVGKTTTIAKLAANFKLREGRQVGLMTADTYRMAAIEQLRRYAELLSVPLQTVHTPDDVPRALQAFQGFDLILIDTAGRSHRNNALMSELKTFLCAVEPHETHLVVSATSRPSNLISVVRRFDALTVDRIVFTKLDEAANFGLILSVAAGLGKKLSYLTTGQEVPADIEVSRPERVARLILGEEAA